MKDYIEKALRTEAPLRERDIDHVNSSAHQAFRRLLHAGMGLCTESGEFMDALKRFEYYGRDLDFGNLKEELGDLLWYIAVACDVLGTTFEELQELNIVKLKKRYPDKFTEEEAFERDLESEQQVFTSFCGSKEVK